MIQHTKKFTALLCILSLSLAALLFAFWQEWIIIRLPQSQSSQIKELNITKKEVLLWFWYQNRWHNEKHELLWSQNVSENVMQLMSALLVLFEEEQLLDKKTTVQSVALSSDGQTALISFDRPPITKQTSVYTKWMMIEAILKTLRTNGIEIKSVQFLTHHQPMQDSHLDFSNPWPTSGFLE